MVRIATHDTLECKSLADNVHLPTCHFGHFKKYMTFVTHALHAAAAEDDSTIFIELLHTLALKT